MATCFSTDMGYSIEEKVPYLGNIAGTENFSVPIGVQSSAGEALDGGQDVFQIE